MKTNPRPAAHRRDDRRIENPGFALSSAIGLVGALLVTVVLPSCTGVGSVESQPRQSVSQQRILEKLQRKTWSDPEAMAEASKSRESAPERSRAGVEPTSESRPTPDAPFDPFTRPGSLPDKNEATPFDTDWAGTLDDPASDRDVVQSEPVESAPATIAANDTGEEPSSPAVRVTPEPTVANADEAASSDQASWSAAASHREPSTGSAPATTVTSTPETGTTHPSSPTVVKTSPRDIDATAPQGVTTAPAGTRDTPAIEETTTLAEAQIPEVGDPTHETSTEATGSPTSLLEALSTGVREALATRAANRETGAEVRPEPARERGDVEPMAVPAARFTESEAPDADEAVLTAATTEALSIELRDVPLKDLIRAIAQQNRMNVIVPETLTERVSISLDGVDPFEAVTSILKSNGYRLVSEGSLHRVEAIAEEEQRMESETFTLTSVPIASVQESLESIVSESGKLIMNDDSPSFVMIDYPENIIAMTDFLRLIDRREKQVLIEVQILEVILDENDAIGTSVEILDIGIDDTTLTYGHDLLPDSAFTTIGVVANQSPITATIEALSIRRKLNILSTPKIVTLNGREASIKVTSSIPYIDATATTSTTVEGGGATVVEQVEFTESGISLNVTPVIANDGYVKLQITPEVRELVDFFNGIPVIDSRRIETNVLCQNGNTVILGGLLREEEMHETQKTPILGDIPLLGAAFRRKEKSISKSELLVFITPYIVEGDAETRLNLEASDRLKEGKKAFTPRSFR